MTRHFDDKFKIDKGVPLPGIPGYRGRRSTLLITLDALEVGDSFIVDMPGRDATYAQSRAAAYGAQLKPKKFTTRRSIDENGSKTVRVWRTE